MRKYIKMKEKHKKVILILPLQKLLCICWLIYFFFFPTGIIDSYDANYQKAYKNHLNRQICYDLI